jgi:membrane protease YdiL (CAAX protease family)
MDRERLKKHLFVLLKTAGFFTSWVLLVSFLMPVLDDPVFINESAFLRLWMEVLPLVFVIIPTLFFVKIIEKNKINTGISRNIIKSGVLGIVFGTSWTGVSILIIVLLGGGKFTGINNVPYLSIWILSAFINVIMQEYLIRGYLFSLIKKEYNVLTAIIITTLVFVLLHGGALEAGVTAVINIITMSTFMSLLLICTGTLITPIIAHGMWNIIGCLLGCVSLADDYPAIINCELTGSKIISGGEYKIEGSIIVLIINVINIIILMALIKSRKAPDRKAKNGVFS